MKILITAFNPFDNRSINISKEVVTSLDINFKDIEIKKVFLPVAINTSFNILNNYILEYHPDIIILSGEAVSREDISIEIKAKNIVQASIDPSDEIDLSRSNKVDKNGPNAIFSEFPTVEALSQLLTKSIPTILSSDAGGYICNALYYKTMLHYPNIPTVFIHFPSFKKITKETMIEALNTIILSL